MDGGQLTAVLIVAIIMVASIVRARYGYGRWGRYRRSAELGAQEHGENQRLREEYRGAFNEWALQVSRLQQTEGNSPDRVIDDAAEGRAAAAEIAYRQTRDRLTDGMRVDAPKPEGRP